MHFLIDGDHCAADQQYGGGGGTVEMPHDGEHVGADAHIQRVAPAAFDDKLYDGVEGARRHHGAEEEDGEHEHDAVDGHLADPGGQIGRDAGKLPDQDGADQGNDRQGHHGGELFGHDGYDDADDD